MTKYSLIIVFVLSTIVSVAQITEIGMASFYADKFDGRITASGEIFNQKKMTAAHRTLPFGTMVKVTNLENSKQIEVVINDRGPFVEDRVIDLSKAAAEKLDFIKKGVAKVKVEVISLKRDNKVVKKPQQTAKKEKPKAASVKPNTTVNTGVEYYKIESSQITPTGFGIQIASYKEAANLMKRCDEIKKTISKDILVQVSKAGDSKVYRILIGPFDNRESAQEYNKSLKNKFKGSFVKAL